MTILTKISGLLRAIIFPRWHLGRILPYLLAALSGLFAALAYPPYDLPVLIWIAFVPFFFAVSRGDSADNAFRRGYLAGVVYFGIVYLWVLAAYPLDWAGIENKTTGGILLATVWFAGVALVNAPFWGFFAAGIHYFKIKTSVAFVGLLPSLFIGVLWIVSEYLRALWFSFFFSGTGGKIGAHFTTGHLGYALHDNFYLLQSADLWGVYGLSFLIISVNFVVFRLLAKNEQAAVSRPIIWLAMFFAAFYFYGAFRADKIDTLIKDAPKIKISLIQTAFPSRFIYSEEEREDKQKIQSSLFEEAEKENSEIIIFPEGSRFVESGGLAKASGTIPIIINQSFIKTFFGTTKSRVAYTDYLSGEVITSDKLLLAPFGEYLPNVIKTPLKIFGLEKFITRFESSRGYIPGIVTIAETRLGAIGTLLCSEPLSPSFVRQMVSGTAGNGPGAEILFNSASAAIFRGSRVYAAQNEAVLRVRAVENRRFIGQAGNYAASFIVDAVGRIDRDSGDINNRVVAGYLRPLGFHTVYNRFGEWLLFFGSALVILKFSAVGNVRIKN